MKWKLFLPIWLAVFLLAPSIWFHRLWMINGRPPGSDIPPKPLFLPFGAINYIGDIYVVSVRGMVRGDFDFITDVIVLFISVLLPILIYTFFLSCIIYYVFQRIRQKRGSGV